jgi:hypothetical protein
MELNQKIVKTILGIKLDNPIVDISSDDNGNIYGHVCSKTFESQQDEQVQKTIWAALKKHLSEQELIKIMILVNETPKQRLMRLNKTPEESNKHDTCLWVHRCPDMTNYWIFIGITKEDSKYSASYFWIDDSNKDIGNGLILIYPKEVLEFMRLEQAEIVPEIYNNAIGNVTAEIKTKIMEKYDHQTKQGRWGNANDYHYVFNSFKLEPVPLSRLSFYLNDKAARRMKSKLKNLPNSFQKSEVMRQLEILKNLKATAIKI